MKIDPHKEAAKFVESSCNVPDMQKFRYTIPRKGRFTEEDIDIKLPGFQFA